MYVRVSSPFNVFLLKVTLDVGWVFAQHFCNRLGSSYLALKNVLDETNPTHAEVLNDIKRRFREETFTRESIAKVIEAYPELVSSVFHLCPLSTTNLRMQIRMLYVNFAMVQYPVDEAQRLMYSLFFPLLFHSSIDLLYLDLHFRTNGCKPSNHSRIGSYMIVSGALCLASKTCKFSRVS